MELAERTEGDVTTLFLKGKMVGSEDDELLLEKAESLDEAGRTLTAGGCLLEAESMDDWSTATDDRISLPLPHMGTRIAITPDGLVTHYSEGTVTVMAINP